jgi:hypothetical protein
MKRRNGMDSVLRYGEAPNQHVHTMKVFVLRVEDGHRPRALESIRRALEEPVMTAMAWASAPEAPGADPHE